MDLAGGRRLVVAAVTSVLLLSACGGEGGAGEAEPHGTTGFDSSPSESPHTSSESETTDGQPVSDAMVQSLMDHANDSGYGPADEGFALLMVDVCRDVESGHSDWAELTAQDIADGAPRADAEQFNGFLRDEFCPSVEPVEVAGQPEPDPEAIGDGTRGVGSTVSFLDARWRHADVAACRTVAGAPLGEARAYSRSGALVCGDYIDGGAWGETLIDLDVAFAPSVSEAAARQFALDLLPGDASFVTRAEHSNPHWAARRGSCVGLVFESSTLGDAILAANPDWSDGHQATATLYSTKQADYGSASEYDGTVGVMSIGVGGDSAHSSC